MMTSYLGSLACKSWKLTKIMPNSLQLLNHCILSNAPQKIRQWALKIKREQGKKDEPPKLHTDLPASMTFQQLLERIVPDISRITAICRVSFKKRGEQIPLSSKNYLQKYQRTTHSTIKF